MNGEFQKSIKEKQKSMCMDRGKVVGIATGSPRVCQSNHQPRRTSERASRKSFRDGRVVVCALEAVVNPTEDGILPRTTATLQSLQYWRDIRAGLL